MAKWYESGVRVGDPVEGDFDFVFDNTTGEIKIVKLVSGEWVTQQTVSPISETGPQGPAGPTGAQGPRGPAGPEGGVGPWHIVGTDGEPVFQTTWTGDVRFRLEGDIVRVCSRGCGFGNSSYLFILPTGYRPPSSSYFHCHGGYNIVEMTVCASGQIIIPSCGNSVAFDITFPVT